MGPLKATLLTLLILFSIGMGMKEVRFKICVNRVLSDFNDGRDGGYRQIEFDYAHKLRDYKHAEIWYWSKVGQCWIQ